IFAKRLKRLTSAFRSGSGSFRNNFTSATMRKSKIAVKGNADTSDAVCKASSPPEYKRTAATADIVTPQTTFPNTGGVKLPFDDILAKMYVAESADVTRNVKINKIETMERSKVNGSCSNVKNNADVTSA